MHIIPVYKDKRCMGCRGCEEHFLEEDYLSVAPRFDMRTLDELESEERAEFVFTPCHYCEVALCCEACPVGAISRREKGYICIEESSCVGCNECIIACPWNVPQWNPETGKVCS